MKAAKFLLLILAVAIVVPMHAQTSSVMKVNVPFDFTVDNHKMPSGDYEFKTITENAILIRSANGDTARVSLTEATGGGIQYKSPSLQFEKLGEEYYLYTAFFGHVTNGRQFARSKQQTSQAAPVVISQNASN